jgi:hypothetical protein
VGARSTCVASDRSGDLASAGTPFSVRSNRQPDERRITRGACTHPVMASARCRKHERPVPEERAVWQGSEFGNARHGYPGRVAVRVGWPWEPLPDTPPISGAFAATARFVDLDERGTVKVLCIVGGIAYG